jgi:hypothetical protein
VAQVASTCNSAVARARGRCYCYRVPDRGHLQAVPLEGDQGLLRLRLPHHVLVDLVLAPKPSIFAWSNDERHRDDDRTAVFIHEMAEVHASKASEACTAVNGNCTQRKALSGWSSLKAGAPSLRDIPIKATRTKQQCNKERRRYAPQFRCPEGASFFGMP